MYSGTSSRGSRVVCLRLSLVTSSILQFFVLFLRLLSLLSLNVLYLRDRRHLLFRFVFTASVDNASPHHTQGLTHYCGTRKFRR